MKRMLSAALAVLMILCCLTGCKSEKKKLAELNGVWVSSMVRTPEQAEELLQSIDACEEEIALADLETMRIGTLAEFDGKTYRFGFDAEQTRLCVEEYFRGYFEDLYEGRETLNLVYGENFPAMTQEEFYAFYASLYECEDYETLISMIVWRVYDYDALEEQSSSGTFTISDGKLVCKPDGQETESTVGYQVSNKGKTLTLSYADGVEVYTKK